MNTDELWTMGGLLWFSLVLAPQKSWQKNELFCEHWELNHEPEDFKRHQVGFEFRCSQCFVHHKTCSMVIEVTSPLDPNTSHILSSNDATFLHLRDSSEYVPLIQSGSCNLGDRRLGTCRIGRWRFDGCLAWTYRYGHHLGKPLVICYMAMVYMAHLWLIYLLKR